jgi:restriction system-associated AAA family ATPase
MKLLRVHVISASSCGGLLDGFELPLRRPATAAAFEPFCLIGPNGAGKSQFLQVLAEIFQTMFQACVPAEERGKPNSALLFDLEYEIRVSSSLPPVRARASRKPTEAGGVGPLRIERRDDLEWIDCPLTDLATRELLPKRVIAYTSGDNETLSAPFLVSRAAYADAVATQALENPNEETPIPEPRLLLIDYSTHLEVLSANLLLGTARQRKKLLDFAELDDIHSFRCIVQLKPRSGPQKSVKLTNELQQAVERLRMCATSFDYDPKRELHTFDYLVTQETRKAFAHYWPDAFALYTTFHKLGMLNDLAIPRTTRMRFQRQTGERRFATRLPEPQDEDKVFRFEQVKFTKRTEGKTTPVDYVALSDGEHQQALLLGVMGMLSYPGLLFLLDEPESHFNPRWRVKFISRILELPTSNGARDDGGVGGANEQECLLTTHAPFVPSDLPRERVLVFSKQGEEIVAGRPEIETYGATFDTILSTCFDVMPPISDVAKGDIEELQESGNSETVRAGLDRLGPSVEKAFVADHLRKLEGGRG